MDGYSVLKLFGFRTTTVLDIEKLLDLTREDYIITSKITGEKLIDLRVHPMNCGSAFLRHNGNIMALHTLFRIQHDIRIYASEPLVYELESPNYWIPISQLILTKIIEESEEPPRKRKYKNWLRKLSLRK